MARVSIAIGLKLYCKRKPLHCIVAGLRVFILQYTVLYCRKNQCIAIGSRLARCIAIHCWKVKCIAMGIVLQGLLDVCCNTNIVLQAVSWEGSVTIKNLYRD